MVGRIRWTLRSSAAVRFWRIQPLRRIRASARRYAILGRWRASAIRISAVIQTVHAGQFGAGRVSAVAATHAQLSSARMMTGNLPVVPSHASLSASGRAAAASTIHNSASQRSGTQTASRPESFQQQTSHLQQSMQQSHVSSVTAGSARVSASGAAESRATASAGSGKPGAGSFYGWQGNQYWRDQKRRKSSRRNW